MVTVSGDCWGFAAGQKQTSSASGSVNLGASFLSVTVMVRNRIASASMLPFRKLVGDCSAIRQERKTHTGSGLVATPASDSHRLKPDQKTVWRQG